MEMKEHQHASYTSFTKKEQRLALKGWHDVLEYIDPAAMKHLEKRGLVETTDTTVASEMKRSFCRECKSQVPS